MIAKMGATIDVYSKGRFAINILTGWFKDEFRAFGEPWLDHDERYRRSEEFIQVLKGLWTQDRLTFKGDFYRINDGWLKPRIGGVRLSNSRTVVRAELRDDQIGLVLDDASIRTFDHVVLATGFRINLARVPFLTRELLAAIRQTAGYPHLKFGFESSIKGLHFIGATAAYCFGSVTRFVAGTTYSAAALSAAICSSARREPNTITRSESALVQEDGTHA